jgi:hypothetical protein
MRLALSALARDRPLATAGVGHFGTVSAAKRAASIGRYEPDVASG